MLTVPEAARRIGRNPETLRRWIREGKLRSRKVGTQHFLEEDDLEAITDAVVLPMPEWWPGETHTGQAMPDVVSILRRQRAEH